MRHSLLGIAGAGLAFAAASALAAPSPCSNIEPAKAGAVRPLRAIEATDLITLRDIGPVANTDVRAPILSVSPDGKSVAFQLRQADLASNAYCFAMFVLPLRTGVEPIQVDVGGEFIRATYGAFGLAKYTPAGPPATITPKWSADGGWIAFLRRDNGMTQVWRAKADGSGSEPVTHLSFDAEDFAWSADGRAILVSGRPGLNEARDAIDQESKSGFLYDDRFVTSSGPRPQPREPIARDWYRVDVRTRRALPATAAEIALAEPAEPAVRPKSAGLYQKNARGGAAWTVSTKADNVVAPSAIHLRRSDGADRVCDEPICNSVAGLWWSDDDKALIYLRFGWRTDRAQLYRWDVDAAKPRLLWDSHDVLIGCQLADNHLICGHETATQPRELISIDVTTGRLERLFDPNPEFSAIKIGAITRLRFQNAFGIETWGDLVLPPDHKAGERHPLIIVQYESRGFLRGGTGDEFPIQLFAAHGFAVLSFQKPPSPAMIEGASSWDELNRLDRQDWLERRSILSSIETGIDAAVALGVVDPDKVGLTGLSDGASTAQYALVHSNRFAAIAMSTCCDEMTNSAALIGPPGVAWFHAMGDPGLTNAGAAAFWQPISLVANARKIHTPVLMQLADREYLSAVASFAALREVGKPVEPYIFPDEYHIKWQPIHRLAVYDRNLQWFDFWLKGIETGGPKDDTQYRRWRSFKSNSTSDMGASPGH